MSIKTFQTEKNLIYFCTFTCWEWLPLFKVTKCYDAIYDWFTLMHEKGNFIVGYVIMPNHLHLLIYISPESKPVNTVVANAKRFLAYEIVKRLKGHHFLCKLKSGVTKTDKGKGSIHRVFTPSFDAKPCYRGKFLEQKLNYIHRNPMQGKWNLVKKASDYPYSSAAFYERNECGLFPVLHYMAIKYKNDEVGGVW